MKLPASLMVIVILGCANKKDETAGRCATTIAETKAWFQQLQDGKPVAPWPTGDRAKDAEIDQILNDMRLRIAALDATKLGDKIEEKIGPLLAKCPAAAKAYEGIGIKDGESLRDVLGRFQGVVDKLADCNCAVDIHLFKAHTYIAFTAQTGLDIKGPGEK